MNLKHSAPPIPDHTILISGFRQEEGFSSGMQNAYSVLYHAGVGGHLIYEEWKQSPKKIARKVNLLGGERVCIVGYSWGCATAARVAVELTARGIDVKAMVLVDPVARIPWAHTYSAFAAWFGWSLGMSIDVPFGVDRVLVLRQTKDRPKSSRVTAGSDMEERELTLYGHDSIDDAPETLEAIIDELDGFGEQAHV